ncbi:HAD family hydrolase [Salipiger abyssi]|uniref:Haloacid dehalogenase superfamily enzyme, subfamily IA n=1 Tax=Salipiger abyssi TaxID=1250539 RepID=A0A1P8UZ37_9RHOB|nr:HAD family phosphatase [Salipiger abyssi]APZ54626.1 haloacid dehalogenase superfamily enzyme, subfamily IA [Salipiger abyssi]
MTKALLFDLDGTLLVSDPLHIAVFGEFFAERGLPYSEEIYHRKIHGAHNAEIFPQLFPGEDAQALAAEKEARFRARLSPGTPPMPGAKELLDRAAREGWAVAVVTNAPRDNAEHMMRAIGLDGYFDVLVIGDECARGKPDPEPYLEAMRRLGVRPQDCIAFEDSQSGMRAASRSGAFAIGICSGLAPDRLREAGAKATITDFRDDALPGLLARIEGETTS